MIERPPSDAPRGLCPVRGGCSARGCAAMRAGCGGLPCALRVTDPLDAPARVVSNPSWLQCARLRCDARGCAAMRAAALRCARLRTAVLQLRWGQRNRPGSDATEHQGAFYFLDRLGDLDAAGAGVGAVEGGTTAPDPLRI